MFIGNRTVCTVVNTFYTGVERTLPHRLDLCVAVCFNVPVCDNQINLPAAYTKFAILYVQYVLKVKSFIHFQGKP